MECVVDHKNAEVKASALKKKRKLEAQPTSFDSESPDIHDHMKQLCTLFGWEANVHTDPYDPDTGHPLCILHELSQIQKMGFECVHRTASHTIAFTLCSFITQEDIDMLTVAIPYDYIVNKVLRFKVEKVPNRAHLRRANYEYVDSKLLQDQLHQKCQQQGRPGTVYELVQMWKAVLETLRKPPGPSEPPSHPNVTPNAVDTTQHKSSSPLPGPRASRRRKTLGTLTKYNLRSATRSQATPGTGVSNYNHRPRLSLDLFYPFTAQSVPGGHTTITIPRGFTLDQLHSTHQLTFYTLDLMGVRQDYPQPLQAALNHIVDCLLHGTFQSTLEQKEVTSWRVAYEWQFPGVHNASYVLTLRSLVQHNLTTGNARRILCQASTATELWLFSSPPLPTFKPMHHQIEQALAWKQVSTSKYKQPLLLKPEEYEKRGLVPIEQGDARYDLLTSGLPWYVEVNKVWLVLQPKERTMFSKALEVEEINHMESQTKEYFQSQTAVKLCWHGAPQEAAFGIVEHGPNTCLSGLKTKRSTHGPGLNLACDARYSLHREYSEESADGYKYLLKMAAIASKPCVNNLPAGSPEVKTTIPSHCNCFVDRAENPRIIVHQNPYYMQVLALIELKLQ